ncbi:uncharacterized protein LOC113359008 [Papaver somniferum]|uniref:uncharacterized protein LOC113359008 n=1 Tax=Papaver somniferum TaxID=3469 RepID=UPI000E6FD7E4|nr:uncharacterized protein LOC113359008 [Papaver somniferum]
MWLEHPTFMEVVKNSWSEEIHGDVPYIFMTKLKHLKHILKKWNWKVFGDVKLEFQEAEGNVKAKMIHSVAHPHNEQALEDLVAAQNEFNSREVQYNTMLKQKSRIKWVKEGSANTNFFHTNIKIRQTKKFILELEDDNDNLISDQKKIADTLVDFFEKTYQYQEVEVNDSILESIPKLITENDQFMLEVIPEADEIKAAVFEIDGDSAPGPDTFSGAKQPNQFRPIGLSNFSLKVFTKILSMRMASLMNKLVSPQQVAYIKSRSIHEQVLLASELVNEMKMKRRGGNVSLKLDITQAYDSVSWVFLFKVLQQYGFSIAWCNWLKELLSSAKISVMVNGRPNGFFSMHRGLKQGDPLSLILFVLMEEVLSKRLQNMVEKNKLQPMMDLTSFPDKYLGVIIHSGRIKTATVWPMVEMMQDYLAVWKGKLLSFHDRLVLIKFVLSSIPIYNMAVYKWPCSVIKECEKIMRNFLWSGDGETRKFTTISWKRVCTPFDEGGLGIRRLSDLNKALLMNMMWNLLNSKEEWAMFFAVKFKDKNGQWISQWKLSSMCPGLKWAWKSLKTNIRWIIGTGHHISVWFDTWAGDSHIIESIGFTNYVKNNIQMKVTDLLQNGR